MGERDACWLIERGQAVGQSPTEWCMLVGTSYKWTTDANSAVRYDTKESAERFLRRYVFQPARAVEHIFIDREKSGGHVGASARAENARTKFLCSYWFDGSRWSLDVWASTREEAEMKLAAIGRGVVDGPVQAEIPQ